MKIKGIITSLVTPMKKNKKIDFKSLKKILDYQKKNNIKNIVVSGTTGESSTIKLKESIKIIKFIKKKYKKSFNIIFCCCSNSTNKSININKEIDKLKIKAILQTVPYYTIPSQKGIIKHFSKIENKIKTPIIIYNIPKRCGVKMEIKTIKKIYKKKGIIGIKNSVENIEYNLEVIKKFSNKNFRIYCGDDTKFHLLTIFGCYGNISAVSNVIPKKMNNIYIKLKKKPLKAYKEYEKIMKIIKIMFIETNPIPIKYILSKMKLIKNFLRLPLTRIQKKNKIIINKIIKRKYLTKIINDKNIKK